MEPKTKKYKNTHTHTHPFNVPLSGTTWVSRYQKGKTKLDFTEARDSEWQWHHLGRMQVCTLLQTDNHANTHHSVFLQAGCPSCRPTNSIKAMKATSIRNGREMRRTNQLWSVQSKQFNTARKSRDEVTVRCCHDNWSL